MAKLKINPAGILTIAAINIDINVAKLRKQLENSKSQRKTTQKSKFKRVKSYYSKNKGSLKK